jgi:hypothetical protein
VRGGAWHLTADARRCLFTKAYLLFDPAVSSHFHIVLFWEEEEEEGLVTVHAYSSETRAWSHSERDWSTEEQHRPTEAWRRRDAAFNKGIFTSRGVFVNGALYVLVMEDGYVILEVDVEGKSARHEASSRCRSMCTARIILAAACSSLVSLKGACIALAMDLPAVTCPSGLRIMVLQNNGSSSTP